MLSTSARRARRLATTTNTSSAIARASSQPSLVRPFAQHSQLLLISRPSNRPQLPYLYANSRLSSPFQQQIARLLSTETRKYIKDSFISAIWVTIYFWTAIGLATAVWLGWRHEEQEAKTPTPPEWSWLTRWYFREAKEAQFPTQLQGFEAPNWVVVAQKARRAIGRLEDPNGDGAGVRSALGEGEGAILVEGVGKTGTDISGKSEPWRRGYFQALMTAGLAAEHVEGYVKDTSRGDAVFPGQVVLGPSNPRPQPMPLTKDGVPDAPREENCVPFFELPQVYYMKVLTTLGFSNDQKLQAALAYADWLGYKGLSSSAREMYDWALDIATQTYGNDQTAPINKSSGVLLPGSSPVTSNLLTAASALAVHFAQTGDLTAALPAFLSILRVQRELPRAQPQPQEALSQSSKAQWGFLSKIIKDDPYPPPPPSGDLPATRTAASHCDEAGTLAHVGEILYVMPASSLPSSLANTSKPTGNDAVEASPSQEAGLAWTRQAVDLAEEALELLSGRNKPQIDLPGNASPTRSLSEELGLTEEQRKAAREACSQCAQMAMTNWENMVGKLASREKDIEIARGKSGTEGKVIDEVAAPAPQGSGWLGLWSTATPLAAGHKPVGKWLEEAATVVATRKRELRQMLREEKLPVKNL